MPFAIRRSDFEPDFFEVWEEGKMIREIRAPFRIRKIPKSFKTLEEIERWLTEIEWKLARLAAYRLIAMRNYPSAELLRKLEQRHYSRSVCAAVVEELKKNGYLRDEDYLEAAILREFQRGFGPRYIALKLRSKGLSGEKAREFITDAMQRKKIREWIEKKKFPKQKIVQFLQRRGFDPNLLFKELD